MKTTVIDDTATLKTMEVEASAEDVKPFVASTMRRLAGEIKVPGFRQGKAPRAVLESRLGKEALEGEVLREAVGPLYEQAVADKSLDPIMRPELSDTQYQLDGPLKFTATVIVRPEIVLPNLKSITVERPVVKVADEEVEEQLVRLQNQHGTLEETSGRAVDGSHVSLSLTTTIHGERVESASADDFTYEVGSGTIVTRLDDELKAAVTGEFVQFNDVIPETATEHAGEEATFRAVIKQVYVKHLPPLDDEFAKTASEFETLDELRKTIADNVESVKEATATIVVRARAIEAVVDSIEVDVPEQLIRGESDEEREKASRRIKVRLILDHVAKTQEIKVSGEEIASEAAMAAQQIGMEFKDYLDEIEKHNGLSLLANDILQRKAAAYLGDQVTVEMEKEPN